MCVNFDAFKIEVGGKCIKERTARRSNLTMPNQNYYEAKMTDCSLPLPYSTSKSEEKFCKYSYTSWCPTCDKESPRRRTRSENSELCRRKGKEMKTFNLKKYDNRCQEFENMEFECDSRDVRLDCCRIRSNLCELPTTYISNNCQIFSNTSNLTKVSSGSSECFEKPSKLHEISPKLVDCLNTGPNLFNMNEKGKTVIRNGGYIESNQKSSGKYENSKGSQVNSIQNLSTLPLRNDIWPVPRNLHTTYPKSDTWTVPKVYSINDSTLGLQSVRMERNPKLALQHHNESFEYESKTRKQNSPKNIPSKLNRTNNCSILDMKFGQVPVSDTCTFFDKKDYDVSNLNEKYFKEVQVLRARLHEIRRKKMQHMSENCHGAREIIEIQSEDTYDNVRIVTPMKLVEKQHLKKNHSNEIKPCARENEKVVNKKQRGEKIKSEIRPQKISIKARSKLSAIKMRQIRSSKVANSISSGSDFTESDASDVEISEKEEAHPTEESESSAECSKTSIKEASPVPEISSQIGAGDSLPCWPLRESLFPHIPPYINFNTHDSTSPFNLPPGRRYLKWKLSTITPIVVRKTLQNTGFQLIRKSNEWLGTWGKHMKSPMFRTLREIQKLNHFPGTFQLGRKDRMWRNLQRLMLKFGQREFGFMPQTFVLPQDLKLLKQCWEHKNGSGDEIFIIKPPASARGVGIKVINKWSQLPKKTAIVVQRYISNPYLINGSKFDLRLYVLVTSFNPLRIYLYPDGLARFASAKYNDSVKDLKDRYMHLTNYSINKLSSQYTANEDANACQGHKWTLSKLWEFMEKEGIDTRALWKNLEILVIKTMICGESPISMLCKENLVSRYNSYELFGVDVLLDDRLKPWLLEVNISPSLHSASPLDAHVKGPLVKALFDMAQFHFPTRLNKTDNSPPCFDPKIYTTALTKKERNKHNYFNQLDNREDYLEDILEALTGDDVRHLTQAEDELTVTGPFNKIFPTSQTYKYLEFMETRYYNRLFDAWECKYEQNRKPGIDMLQDLCSQKVHLKVATTSNATKNLQNMIPVVLNLEPSTEVLNGSLSRTESQKATCGCHFFVYFHHLISFFCCARLLLLYNICY
ncbi:Tubulin-tyrosine ligase family [Popillia japonica]|uniref:Tubulin-tyrosine ligase family n=1 Tax=Popillia japonica TaxID=7064 RepID=A0AAW1N2H0_POPJA